MPGGFVGMMTPFNWMFLSSFQKLRIKIFEKFTLTNFVRPEFHAFFDSAFVTICAFTLFLRSSQNFKGAFIDLQKFYGADIQPTKAIEAIKNPDCGWFYRASAADFKKIPGSPIAYWVGDKVIRTFDKAQFISSRCSTRKGMSTGLNSEFVRMWSEVSISRIGFRQDRRNAEQSRLKWFPYANGGEYRKWYGNYDDVVNWENDGERLQTEQHESGRIRAVNLNLDFIFKDGLSWSSITSGNFSIRYLPHGFLFSSASNALFSQDDLKIYLGLLNSKVHAFLGKAINPTLNANPGDIGKIPLPTSHVNGVDHIDTITSLSRRDWDAYETSWGFSDLPLLSNERGVGSERQQEKRPIPNFPLDIQIVNAYVNLRTHWQKIISKLQCLEVENNRIFIEAYGLQDELTHDVPLKEIALTCNPHYRYGVNYCEVGSEKLEAMEARLLEDTMKEFISYSVGCMFGRYSLDMPGLVLANQGETVEDYTKKLAEWKNQAGTISQTDITFNPNMDNVIPVLDGDWFTDDIVERFQRFLHVTFGDEYYEANLKFIEKALGKDIRRYFLKDFYNDHVRRYKKRPIYWLFSSPKGSFNALIYMHRYRSDTVSVVLNDYLREFRTKLISRKNHLEAVSISANASQGEKTKALKEIESLKKIINELDAYERDVMYPLATEQLEIDLDDGVKVNYLKFGAALKKIPGLDAKGEE